MTAVTTPAGVFSHVQINWHGINWDQIYQNVKRLQARIVKAVR